MTHSHVDPLRIFQEGHSEGPLTFYYCSDVLFLVLLSMPIIHLNQKIIFLNHEVILFYLHPVSFQLHGMSLSSQYQA